MLISSKDNPRLKHARSVRDGKVRDQIFVEGLRLCEEVLKTEIEIIDVFFSNEFNKTERSEHFLHNFPNANEVPDQIFASISDTKSPQGIIVIAKKPRTESLVFTDGHYLILHKLNNPINVGAILRTAEAAGISGVILTKGTADVFSTKALRGAMGASLRLPIWDKANFWDAIQFCQQNDLKTVCADIRAEKSHTEIDWSESHAIIVGSEAHGLTDAEREMCNESLKIPMCEPVESLNVAVACGILLFEATRKI
jgi:RNA methyltransferase, TrmH family